MLRSLSREINLLLLPVFQAAEEDAYEETSSAAAPEFTTIQPTGEMLSEPVAPVGEVAAPEQSAAPIEHESAVQSVTLAEAEHVGGSPDIAFLFHGGQQQELTRLQARTHEPVRVALGHCCLQMFFWYGPHDDISKLISTGVKK